VRSLLFVFLIFLAAGARAQETPEWTNPFPPYRIVGNIYYVGSQGLAAFLIVTPQGNILINSNLEKSVPMLRESVEKLGFRFKDTKILLISHAHFDHCAGSAAVKELTGAKYMVMDADVSEIEAGGKIDYGRGVRLSDSGGTQYQPTKVDRVLHDGDEVKLGGSVLVAHLTPGHTKGTTTWTMKVKEGDKIYNVVIVGSPNVNPGYKLVNNPLYPNIAEDYEKMFRVLNSLPIDVFLGAHGNYYGMEAKYARMKEGGPNPFIDPDGYKSYISEREQTFRAELAKQKGEAQ